MFTATTARVSHRISAARARRQATGATRTSRGEVFAIGLGCDGYKARQH